MAARLTTARIVGGHARKEFRLRDLGWHLEQADIHDEIYGGVGGLDGDAAVAGQRKPYGIGAMPGNVEAKLMVADSRMPRAKIIDARRVWDTHKLDLAFDALPTDGEEVSNP